VIRTAGRHGFTGASFFCNEGTMTKKNGRLNTSSLIDLINKKAGETLAYDLTKDNPTEVKQWIPTGSTWLNKIICVGNTSAGIPVGKVTELAGLESSGKSFMAAQIAANAQKMGFQVVYFDSESAISPGFLEQAGCDLGKVTYVQAKTVEYVFETMEYLIGELDIGIVFIWDSVAQTPTRKMLDEDYDPQSSIGYKARVLSKAMKKMTIPLANSQSTLLALNQLKTNITTDRASLLTEPYVTPGGKALPYSYSLRIWLTMRKAKASYVTNEYGLKVGSEVKARIKKSRFGSMGRECTFKILWGNDVGIQDEESWFEAIQSSEHVQRSGAWYTLLFSDGTSEKFQFTKWAEKMKNEKFKSRVLEIMDEIVVQSWHPLGENNLNENISLVVE